MTTLCLDCAFGLVRAFDDTKGEHYINKCLLGMDYPGNIIVTCNRYRKTKVRVTYHDPDFEDWEKALKGEDDEVLEQGEKGSGVTT